DVLIYTFRLLVSWLWRFIASLLSCTLFVIFSVARRPPGSTLFPYTTLFRISTHSITPRERIMLPWECIEFAAQPPLPWARGRTSSEEHTSELQSPYDLVCRLLLVTKHSPPRLIAMEIRCTFPRLFWGDSALSE